MDAYNVSPWVAIGSLALVLGWQFIGFPAWLRQQAGLRGSHRHRAARHSLTGSTQGANDSLDRRSAFQRNVACFLLVSRAGLINLETI